MNIETSLPYSWLRSLPSTLRQEDEIPLFGTPSLFPWEAFGQVLGKALQIQSLRIKPIEIQWRPEEELMAGLGADPVILTFQAPPP